MSYINLLGQIGEVENKEECLEYLKELTGLSDDLISLNLINNSADILEERRYFGEGYREQDAESILTRVLWVYSGYNDRYGDKIYFSFVRDGVVGWLGAFVGTYYILLSTAYHNGYVAEDVMADCNYSEGDAGTSLGDKLASLNIDVSNNKPYVEDKKSQNTDKRTQEEAEAKESVGSTSTFDKVLAGYKGGIISNFSSLVDEISRVLPRNSGLSSDYLKSYIKTVCTRILHCIEKSNLSHFIVNKDCREIATALPILDKFGRELKVVFNVDGGVIAGGRLVASNTDLLRHNFSREDVISLPTFSFFNSVSESVFSADVEDFDLTNGLRLEHCIVQRKHRFSRELQNLSIVDLSDRLTNAVVRGIKISKYDVSYIRPVYSTEYDSIQYIIPFHRDGVVRGKPELGIIVASSPEGFWNIMTILPYDEAFNNIRTLSPYIGVWG